MSKFFPLIVAFVLSCLIGSNVFAALAATTVWEIEQNATVANVNGGGFNPSNAQVGSDESQSPTSHANGTNLASSNGSTNPCVITSATYNFISSDNGNLIHINAGTSWLASVYEIVSTSGNAATLDRACGSVASISGGTWHLGGAFSMQDASDGTTFNFSVSGNQWWIKSGTYSMGANWNLPGTGTAAASQRFEGYQTSRGDTPTGNNRPLIKLNGNLILWNGAYWNIANISTIGTSTNDSFGAFGATGSFERVSNCKAVNQSTGNHAAMIVGADTTIIGCEMVAYGGPGLSWSSNTLLNVSNSYFHDSANGIFQGYGGSSVAMNIQNSVFENFTTAAINLNNATATGPYLFQNNTFYGGETSKGGIGIDMLQTSPGMLTAYNNIFYGLSTAINLANAASVNTNIEDYNTFSNNTTDRNNISTGSHSVTKNPGFTNVGQIVNSGTVTSSGSVLTDTTQTFTQVVAGRDFLTVTAMTGGNGPGIYGITTTSGHTVTTDNALGSGSAITYFINYGHNFAPSPTMKGVARQNIGNPSTATYPTLGAAQRHEYGRPVSKK